MAGALRADVCGAGALLVARGCPEKDPETDSETDSKDSETDSEKDSKDSETDSEKDSKDLGKGLGSGSWLCGSKRASEQCSKQWSNTVVKYSG